MADNLNENKSSDSDTPSIKEITINFFAQKEIELIEDKIDDLRGVLQGLSDTNLRLQKQINRLLSEKWKDTELQELKREADEAQKALNRGFPIDEADNKKINNWISKHDAEVHNNPDHYHGASGGGYEYVFHPTGLGTIGYCICSTCKNNALKACGAKYWDELKQNNGYIEFGDFG